MVPGPTPDYFDGGLSSPLIHFSADRIGSSASHFAQE
jgi:hypothetical protein